MADKGLFAALERFLYARNAAVVGCADLGVLPAENRAGLPKGVCIGVGLTPSIVAGIAGGPTKAYGGEYDRANALLQRLGEDCAAYLRERGFRAVSCEPTVEVRDYKTLSTLLPHKTVATRAGIGWIGKCALLVSKTHGSAVRYNTVLTDAPLPAGTPVLEPSCGDCSACVDACPAHAPSGRDWRPELQREDFFDAFACRDASRRQARESGLDHTICGICIAACPFTRRHLAGSGCPVE